MTTATDKDQAFAEGLHREQGLIAEREDWPMEEWLKRIGFLWQQFRDEDDPADRARLQGRIEAVHREGARRFKK